MTTRRIAACSAAIVVLIGTVSAQQPSKTASASGEATTARRFAAIKNDPPRLRAFLAAMPKGGDLHNHLSGAVYAEHYVKWAADDGLCLATATMSLTGGTCDEKAGTPSAASVLRNSALFNQAIDAMSMRHWDPSLNGHDHFFATFGKFGPSSAKLGDMLAAVTSSAAAEHVSYMELMVTPDGGAAAAIGQTVQSTDLPRWREQLLAAGLRDRVVTAAKQRLDAAEARQREVQKCGTPDADAGCGVVVRYVAQVSRAASPQVVFAQMVAWFELVGAEPRVVSLNLVQPEDDPNAVRDFAQQMQMLDFLHGRYPAVPLTMHAGELADGLVPPPVLRSHIRDTVRIGHARRIGHGVAIMMEDDPASLLREMARQKILVEINLTSNDLILGVKGRNHPLRVYLQAGVPVALSTDDMGVSRSTHTLEFVKAVQEHGLDYLTLKRLVRNSIDFSFADAATKGRLRSSLSAAFAAFERQPS
jgi:adenosine deaminase